MSGRLPVVESAAFVLSLSTLIEFPLPLNSLRYGVRGTIFMSVNAICVWPSLDTDYPSLLWHHPQLSGSHACQLCVVLQLYVYKETKWLSMTIKMTLPLTLSCLFSFPHGFLLFCSHAMLMDHLQLQVSIPALPVNDWRFEHPLKRCFTLSHSTDCPWCLVSLQIPFIEIDTVHAQWMC